MKLTCRSCGWRHVYPQRSDAVVLPGACAACGGEDLERTVAGPLDGAAALAELILRRLKGCSRLKP
ncbi:UNVERIFIED_ORG: ribosomal protein S27E [Paraburkholderia sediminicola]|uniref:hypothetical protein n=1 Tax=Paraburkholderia sp. GAS82 TaxID=3035137 RepID=UPI002112038F|nr:ribosomal protein S27E [Paraburkholderia sediminicola]